MKYDVNLIGPLLDDGSLTIQYESFPLKRRIVTTAKIIDRHGAIIAKGAAIRMPKDRNDYKLGCTIAIGRAIKQLIASNRFTFPVDTGLGVYFPEMNSIMREKTNEASETGRLGNNS